MSSSSNNVHYVDKCPLYSSLLGYPQVGLENVQCTWQTVMNKTKVVEKDNQTTAVFSPEYPLEHQKHYHLCKMYEYTSISCERCKLQQASNYKKVLMRAISNWHLNMDWVIQSKCQRKQTPFPTAHLHREILIAPRAFRMKAFDLASRHY